LGCRGHRCEGLNAHLKIPRYNRAEYPSQKKLLPLFLPQGNFPTETLAESGACKKASSAHIWKISKSLAKVLVVNSLELKEIPRLSITNWTREHKFSVKAALCAKSIRPKYLIARRIG